MKIATMHAEDLSSVMAADDSTEDTDLTVERPHTLLDKLLSRGNAESFPPLAAAALRSALTRHAGQGFRLPAAQRQSLRPILGFDPAHARMHRDPLSVTVAQRLKAKAFTIGSDVFFGRGNFAPDTLRGRSLLAHELTHVRQQTGWGESSVRFYTEEGGDTLEREAQRASDRVYADAGKEMPLPGSAVQRVRIKNNVSNGTQDGGARTGDSIHNASMPARPSMHFAYPLIEPVVRLPEAPESDGQRLVPATSRPGASNRPIDIAAIADRLYHRMLKEAVLGRARGLSALPRR